MIKKIIFISSSVLIVIALIVIIIFSTKKNNNKIITVNTHYSYVHTETKKMTIPVYITAKKHYMYKIDSYSTIYITDKDENNKLDIKLEKISIAESERYLHEEYFKLNLIFTLPKLRVDFSISEAFLNIHFINEDFYRLSIGSLYIMPAQNVGNESFFKIESLYGERNDQLNFPRLKTILIEGEYVLTAVITSLKIGGNLNINAICENNLIKLEIPLEELMLTNCPIIITYKYNNSDYTQVIDNFTYFDSYDVLESSGRLINVKSIN